VSDACVAKLRAVEQSLIDDTANMLACFVPANGGHFEHTL